MSFSTLGFPAISMYTVPTTQHSSPCRTSSTRSTNVGFCPPILPPCQHAVPCTPTYRGPTMWPSILRSRAMPPPPAALQSSSIASTAESTCRQIVASSADQCLGAVRNHVAGCRPKHFEMVLRAHPHWSGQCLRLSCGFGTHKGSPLSMLSSISAMRNCSAVQREEHCCGRGCA
jgi:hypothetical protein